MVRRQTLDCHALGRLFCQARDSWELGAGSVSHGGKDVRHQKSDACSAFVLRREIAWSREPGAGSVAFSFFLFEAIAPKAEC